MTGAGLGDRVALIRLVKNRPSSEPSEAARELRSIFVEEIARELVDRNDDN